MSGDLDRLARIESKIDELIREVTRVSAVLPSLEKRLNSVEETLCGNDVDKGLCSKVTVLWYLVVVFGLTLVVLSASTVVGSLLLR